jgi:putative ATPase
MASESLFQAPVPLAVALRPTSVDEVLGQDHVLGEGSPLRLLADPNREGPGPSVILWGPPGTGKTTLASVIARSSGRKFVELSAVTAGVKDVREVMADARIQGELSGRAPVLFLDEIHRFSKAQQDALLPGVENGLVVLIAATTENPSFSVVAPLLSRSLLVTLKPLEADHIEEVLDRGLTDSRGLAGRFTITGEARDQIVRLAGGDARRALTALEAIAGVSNAAGSTIIEAEHISAALDRALVRYDSDGDQHYDVISAFIKSIRGSDADAAVQDRKSVV